MSLDVYLECKCCGSELFAVNVTHNLNAMAKAFGLYEPMWRPDEAGITTARELAVPLAAGFLRLAAGRSEAEKLNPENGWGSYSGLVDAVSRLLAECRIHPDALVKVSR